MKIRQACAGIIIFFAVLGIAAPAERVVAFITPQIYFTELKIDKQHYSPGERIGGTVTLWNFEPEMASDLHFEFSLLRKTGDSLQLIDSRNGDSFSLFPGEKRNADFAYWLPYKLPSGDFFLRVKTENSRGTVFSWSDAPLTTEPSGDFFELAYDPADGSDGAINAAISLSQRPSIRFTFKRPSRYDTSSTIAHVIRFSSYEPDGSLVRESDLPVALTSLESRVIDYGLEQFDNPGTYETIVRVLNKGSGDVVSNTLTYSWIVKDAGPVARILFCGLDKDAYAAGDQARLNVRFYSVGANGAGDAAELSAVLAEKDGKTVAEKKQTVVLDEGFGFMEIPISQNIDNPAVTLSINLGKTQLDRYQFQARVGDKANATSTVSAVTPDQGKEPSALIAALARIFLVLGVLSLVSLAIFAAYYFKTIRPANKQKKMLKAKASQAKIKEESLSDLLKEFNEIDKKNKQFKTWKRK
jgi:hypothetical protein